MKTRKKPIKEKISDNKAIIILCYEKIENVFFNIGFYLKDVLVFYFKIFYKISSLIITSFKKILSLIIKPFKWLGNKYVINIFVFIFIAGFLLGVDFKSEPEHSVVILYMLLLVPVWLMSI